VRPLSLGGSAIGIGHGQRGPVAEADVQAMGAAGRLDLLPGVAPLGPRLIHLAGGCVCDGVLLQVLASDGELDDLSRAGNHGRVQCDGAAARKNELVESDAELMRRGEVGVESAEDARATGDRSDGNDMAGGLRAVGMTRWSKT